METEQTTTCGPGPLATCCICRIIQRSWPNDRCEDHRIREEVNNIALPNLRAKRKELGYLQREVSDGAGIAISTLRNIECGHKTTSRDTANRISEYLLVPVDVLMGKD